MTTTERKAADRHPVRLRLIPTFHLGPHVEWGSDLAFFTRFLIAATDPALAVRLLACPPADLVSVEYA